MIKAIIVDDELTSVQLLSNLLKKHCDQIDISGEFTDIESAYDFISLHSPQLVFLDIDMPPFTGFDLLKRIEKPSFEVIFVTAYDHYAIEAIKFSALYYILKPVNIIELKEAVKRAVERISNNQVSDVSILNKVQDNNYQGIKRIVLNHFKGSELVDIEDILYLEANQAYTSFVLVDEKKIICSKNLAEYEKMLFNKGFFRIHKSFMVNMKFVKSLDRKEGLEILLINDIRLPLSRTRKAGFIDILKL
ncbi:MAG: response regulator transcription factor [Chitinophagales bacterium]|nr:response regulator transcription factor [Chitinophagales bacterium]